MSPSATFIFYQRRGAVLGLDISLPWDWTKVKNLMTAEQSHYNISKYSAAFPNILEVCDYVA